MIDAIEATRRRDDADMPFQKGIRVACPMKNFQSRQTIFCLSCDMFKGICVKGKEGQDVLSATENNKIICAHPISRKLSYFPED
jgi:hypothetical protein